MTIKFIKEELNDQGNTANEFYKVIENNIEYIIVKCFDYGGTLCEVYIDKSELNIEDVFSEKLVDELWEENSENGYRHLA